MRSMLDPLRTLALCALAGFVLASCGGGPRFQKEACARQYTDCTDACADRCEPIGPADDSRPPTLNDNDIGAADCAQCVTACDRKASRCEGAPPPIDDQ